MKATNLVLRCYAERQGDQWVAICLDLCLAAQADTFEEARHKLHEQVVDYVQEALGDDREHAHYLLNRKAPLQFWARYYLQKTLWRISRAIGWSPTQRARRAFRTPVPMKPAMC